MIHRGFWRVGVILATVGVLLSGVVTSGQSNDELLASLNQVLQELIVLRQQLWDLETTIISSSSPDLLAFEAVNFEYERRILDLTARFLAIREAMHGMVPPPVIDEKISLVKAELAAAWLENSMIEGKLSIKKRDLLSQAVANDPPRSCFTLQDGNVFSGAPVTFLDCSSDLEGGIESWAWLFGDGTTSDDSSPTHVYENAGTYEVSLVVTDKDGAAGRFSSMVEVEQAHGTLSILSDASLQEHIGQSPKAILVIFDTSSSMDESFEGSTRLVLAKEVLKDFLSGIPEGVRVGLRIFGSCDRSTLAFPVQLPNTAQMASIVAGIRAKGATPLALSLSLAATDLAGVPEAKAILLITDGQESCGGDPVRAAQDVMTKISDLRIHVVGFEVQADVAARQQLEQVAIAGGGLYVDATSSSELASAFRLVAPIAFRVVDASGAVVSSGILGDPVPPLMPGSYAVFLDLPTGGTTSASVELPIGGRVFVRVGYSQGEYFVAVE